MRGVGFESLHPCLFEPDVAHLYVKVAMREFDHLLSCWVVGFGVSADGHHCLNGEAIACDGLNKIS